MVEKPGKDAKEWVTCAVCEKQVAMAEALTTEDPDYLLYFCGQECYDEWAADELAVKVQEAGQP